MLSDDDVLAFKYNMPFTVPGAKMNFYVISL